MKVYVWNITSRLLHWVLAISFAGAYILGETESNFSWHVAFGITVFSATIIRIIWGLIGPKYSMFTDFPISPKSIMEFINHILKREKKVYLGHNPLASIVMLLIYLFAILSAFSGMAIVAKSGSGFAFLAGLQGNEDSFKEIHEAVTGIFLFLVIFHLVGILVDVFINKGDSALASIFSGFKSGEGESVKLNPFQKFYSVVSILFVFFAFGYNIANPTILKEDENEGKEKMEKFNGNGEVHEKSEHDKD